VYIFTPSLRPIHWYVDAVALAWFADTMPVK